jgi:hypothetical protein
MLSSSQANTEGYCCELETGLQACTLFSCGRCLDYSNRPHLGANGLAILVSQTSTSFPCFPRKQHQAPNSHHQSWRPWVEQDPKRSLCHRRRPLLQLELLHTPLFPTSSIQEPIAILIAHRSPETSLGSPTGTSVGKLRARLALYCLCPQ